MYVHTYVCARCLSEAIISNCDIFRPDHFNHPDETGNRKWKPVKNSDSQFRESEAHAHS